MDPSKKKSLYSPWDLIVLIGFLPLIVFGFVDVFRHDVHIRSLVFTLICPTCFVAGCILGRLPPIVRILGKEWIPPLRALEGLTDADKQAIWRQCWKKVWMNGLPGWILLLVFLCWFVGSLILSEGSMFWPAYRPILMLFVVLSWFPVAVFVLLMATMITALLVRRIRPGEQHPHQN